MKSPFLLIFLIATLFSCQNPVETTASEDNAVLKFYLRNDKDSLSKIMDDRIINLYIDEEYDSIVNIFKTEPYNSDVKLGLYGSSLVRIGNLEKAKELAVNLDKIGLEESYLTRYKRIMPYYNWGEIDEKIGSYELMFLHNYLVESGYPTVFGLINKVVSKNDSNPFGLLSNLVINYRFLNSSFDIEGTLKEITEQNETLKLLKEKYPNWKKITEYEIYDIQVRNINYKIYNFDTAFLKMDSLIGLNYHADEYRRNKKILLYFKKNKTFMKGDREFLSKTVQRLRLL